MDPNSTMYGYKPTKNEQLWCSECTHKFYDPRRLPECGHLVCGPNSPNKCVERVLHRPRPQCPVASCMLRILGMILVENLALPDLEGNEEFLSPEYKEFFKKQNRGENKQTTSNSTIGSGATSKTPRHKPPGNERVSIVKNLVYNERRKILIVGKTGTGKSSLCNILAGLDFNNPMFAISADAQSCTEHTILANAYFNGNVIRPISIIDTIGFDDPDRDTDTEIIDDLRKTLKNRCDHVNLFALAVNGQNPRLDGSLVGMIGIFQEMFGEAFWPQTVVIFTRLSMKESAKADRERIAGKTDQKLAQEYLIAVRKKFPSCRALKYLFIDSCRDRTDTVSEQTFQSSMDQLWSMLQGAPELPTDRVKKAQSEKAKLVKQIENSENEIKVITIQLDKRTQEFEDYKLIQQEVKEALENDMNAQKRTFEQQIQQIQKDQEILRDEQAKESAAKQAFLEQELMDLKEQQKKMKAQGSSEELQLKIAKMEKQQEDTKRKYEEDKQEQELRFSNQFKQLKKEKDRLEKELQKWTQNFERELAKQLATKGQKRLTAITSDNKEYKSQQEQFARLLKEMEKRHAEELRTLRKELEETYFKNLNILRQELESKIKALEDKMEKLIAEQKQVLALKEKRFEEQIEELKKTLESLVRQQEKNKELEEKIAKMEHGKLLAEQNYKKEKDNLGKKYSDQIEELKKEKFQLESELKQKEQKLKTEFEKQKSAKEKLLKSKQQRELLKLEEAAYKAELISKTKSNLVECAQMKLDLEGTLEKVKKIQMSSYPEHTWIVTGADIRCNFKIKSKPELGELIEIKNEHDCLFNLSVYAVVTAKLTDIKETLTTDSREKAQKIADEVCQSEKFIKSSLDKVAEEVESQLNKYALKWLVIQVSDRKFGSGDSVSSDWTNVSSVYGIGNQYTLNVFFLSN